MKKIDFFGISFLSCGVFDTSAIPHPHSSTRSPNLKLNEFIIELPFDVGGTNYIDNTGYEITTDSVFFLKPGSVRYTLYPLKCLCLHFHVTDPTILKLLESIPTYSKPLNREEIYECLFKLICLLTKQTQNFEISILACFFKLIDLILQNNSVNTLNLNISLPSNAVIKAKNYIELNYHTKITLEQLSDMVSLSPIYFQRLFTTIIGKSPHKYLLDKRLSVAKELLLISNHSLAKISNMCGFSSQSRFNIVFKQNEGLTPTEYKNKNRIKNL